jgi:pimeloyl-ACP methyl ester carboxylesterase
MKTAEASIEIPHYFLETRDGVRLRYFDTDAASVGSHTTRPALLLANGLGGPVAAFRPYVRALGAGHRLLSWDYRGLYGSTLGPGPRPRLDVAAHVSDVVALLDRTGLERVTFVGWSMGVQIALELFKRHPERIAALVLLNGAAGRPLRGMTLPFAEPLLAPVVRQARHWPGLGQRVLETASRFGGTASWLKRLGAVASDFDEGLFREMLDGFKAIDLERYFALLEELCRHDASDVVPRVTAPTLIVTGARDLLTPAESARDMHRSIRGSEFMELPRGTHYSAAEFPAPIAARIAEFVARRVSAR